MAIGCTAEDKRAGSYFIAGRALGLFVIGLIFVLVGSVVQGYFIYFIIAFAALSILLGIIMLYEAISGKRLSILEALSFSGGKKRHGIGKGPGGKCGRKNIVKQFHECPKKGKRRRSDAYKRKREFFLLGILRGATPCLKLMTLVPLLIVSGLVVSTVLLAVFAVSSSVYPIIGFVGMSVFDGAEKYSRHLKMAGAIIIIVLGIYVPLNHYLNSGSM